MALAAVCAAVLTSATYLPYVLSGGWVLDDWSLAATFDLSGSQSLPNLFSTAYGITTRPGQAAYLVFMWKIGGLGQAPYLAVAGVLAGIEGVLLYFLFKLAFPRLIAALAAALVVVLPVIDATRLWAAASGATLAVIFVACGYLVALAGLRERAHAARRLMHGFALLLFAAGTLTYELVAPLVALAVFTYALQSGWRPAFRRWPFDVAVAISCTAVTAIHHASNTRPARTNLGFLLDRTSGILRESKRVFLDSVPLGPRLWNPFGLVLVIAVVILLAHAVVRGVETVPLIVHNARLLAVGTLLAIAGLVLLLPADPYYVPRVSGIGNRIGAVAAVGVVIMMGALAMLGGLAIAHLVRAPKLALPLGAVLLATTLGVNIRNELRAQKPWTDSWRMSQKVVAAVRASLPPRPPRDTSVVTFRHVTNILPADVPVFYASWDLTGALRLTYRTLGITGHPWNPQMRCAADGVRFPDIPSALRYSHLWFVDASAYRAYRVGSAGSCTRQRTVLSR
jgi:hypothetical protein